MSVYSAAIIKDGPEGYWRLSEASGTTAHDSSGNGHNGTISGSGITYSQTGAIAGDSDTAFLFDGAHGKITGMGVSPINWTKITLEAWVKLSSNSFAQKATIWATGTTPTNSGDGIDFWIGPNGVNGGFAVGVLHDRWAQATFSQTFTAGTWYYIAGVWDGSTVTVYVNGVKNGTTGSVSGQIDDTGSNLAIGVDPQKNGDFFPGTMDEPAIYGKALSASQVQAHYANGLAQVATNTQSVSFITQPPGAVFLTINDVLYPTILQETINIARTANDPIPTFTFTLQDDPSHIPLSELAEVVFLDAGQIPNPTHNLLSNPAMNPYNTNWTYTSHAGVTPSTNGGGGLALAFSNASNGASVKLSQTTQNGEIVAGQQYMASVQVQGTSTPTNVFATLQVNFLDQNGNFVSSASTAGPTPPSGTTTQYTLQVSVPTGIYYLQMQLIGTTSSATNSGNIIFTQAQLEPMTFATGRNFQLSYPTPWCASGQTNCFVLPDGTCVRQFRLFGGLITKATAGAHIGLNRQWSVTVSGYAWLLQKQILNDSWTAQTDSSIINSFVTKYFNNVFSTANVASTNSFSNTLSYQYNGTGRDLFDALQTNSGYIYGSDPYWTLFYQPPGYNSLNFELSDTPDGIVSFPYYGYSRDIDATQLGNNIYVTGATGLAAIVIDAQSVATYANKLTTATGAFWRQVNNSALNSAQACIDAGIGEASEYGYARPIVHLSTNQFMVPGYTIYLTSRTDSLTRASFLIQKVTLVLVGFQSLGYATYECQCDLGAFNPELTNILSAILRLQTSTTTGTASASYYGPVTAPTPSIGLMATETINFYDSIVVAVTSTTPIMGIPTAQYGTAQATYGSNLVGYQ